MGSVAAIDMGVVVMRCAIFDRRNTLFPMKIRREVLASGEAGKQQSFFFAHELSFYSVEHGGTYHFFQFNILQAAEFIESTEFRYICDFFRVEYAD